MVPVRALPVLAALLLSACATTPGDSSGAERQLRAQNEGELRRAGISQACIDSLDANALAQVNALTQRSPRGSREVLLRRQQLRQFVGSRYCPDL